MATITYLPFYLYPSFSLFNNGEVFHYTFVCPFHWEPEVMKVLYMIGEEGRGVPD